MTPPDTPPAPAGPAPAADWRQPAAVVARARDLAERLLWPAAAEIDRSPTVPAGVLDGLAAAGLYGIAGPADAGGLDADLPTLASVVEALGGASLATAFVWIQHHTSVRTVAAAGGDPRRRWLEDLCAGRLRAGIAIAALRRPGPPAMTARAAEGGWVLDGAAPWVTGWGLIDVVLVGARSGDELCWFLLDAEAGPGWTLERLDLAAVDASSTVEIRLEGVAVPADRLVAREPFEEWRARDRQGLATNGFLAVGVAARAATLLESPALAADVDAARRALLGAAGGDPGAGGDLAAARASASLLAVRATTALVAAGGGRSIGSGHHAQRLAREAMFLLVFGQTKPIRERQLADLGVGPPRPG